jgi:hypothetical protein
LRHRVRCSCAPFGALSCATFERCDPAEVPLYAICNVEEGYIARSFPRFEARKSPLQGIKSLAIGPQKGK